MSTGVSLKRKRPPKPSDFTELASHFHSRAKIRAFQLLDRCLTSYCIDSDEHRSLMEDVAKAFQVNTNEMRLNPKNAEDTEMIKKEQKIKRQSYRVENVFGKQLKIDKSSEDADDGSNASCEICNKEGNLLCCDSCSLVFHLNCLRPKLDFIPDGSWSCPYCIVDGLAFGDIDVALDSISKMRKLCHSRINAVEANEDPNGKGFVSRLGKVKERLSILKTTGRYILRTLDSKSSFVELGRYWNLEEALKAYVEYSNVPNSTSNSENFCSFCMSDDMISVCAFCGCKKCFKKSEIGQMIKCSSCLSEFHCVCANIQMPISNKQEQIWRCQDCAVIEVHEEPESKEVANLEQQSLTAEKEAISLEEESPENIIQEASTSAEDFAVKPREQRTSKMKAGQASGATQKRPYNKQSKPAKESDLLPQPEQDVLLPVTLENILPVIANISQRPLTENEKSMIRQFRQWATLAELETILPLLENQQTELLRKRGLNLKNETSLNS